MHNNKLILKYCPNFDKIINTDFLEGDNISLQLIKIYQEFIFKIDLNNYEDIEEAQTIDRIMGKYVDDYFFRKTLEQEMRTIKVKKNAQDIVRAIVESIIEIFKKYEIDTTRKIYISRWI